VLLTRLRGLREGRLRWLSTRAERVPGTGGVPRARIRCRRALLRFVPLVAHVFAVPVRPTDHTPCTNPIGPAHVANSVTWRHTCFQVITAVNDPLCIC